LPLIRRSQVQEWHPTQTTKVIDDLGEKVELRMMLGNLEEIKHLVMSWEACAKVIAPEKLREAVKKEATAMVRSYKAK
jgi:predicted DNA-binding transcriptional regulator YafY